MVPSAVAAIWVWTVVGAVAEFGGADGEFVAAVVPQHHACLRMVTVRRHGVDHAERDALADQPGRAGGVETAAARQRVLDQRQALVEAVAAVFDVGLGRTSRDHGVAGLHDVAPAQRDRVHADAAGELVHGRFDREVRLAQAIAAEGAARHRVGIDRIAVDLLVGAAVDADRLAAGVMQHAGAVIAVSPGVGDDPQRDGGQRAVAPDSGLHIDLHRMPVGGAGELLLAGELELDRPPGPQRRQRDDVLDQHFLLAAEAAADPLAVDPHPGGIEAEQGAQGAPGQERGLRARTHVEATGVIEPGDCAVGFEMGVLDALGDVGSLVDEIGLRETPLDIADVAVDLGEDIARGIEDARLRPVVVDDRRARRHRLFGIEHRREHLVVHHEATAAFLRGGFAVGDDCGDPLAGTAHDVVEDDGVVGIVMVVLVTRGGEAAVAACLPK